MAKGVNFQLLISRIIFLVVGAIGILFLAASIYYFVMSGQGEYGGVLLLYAVPYGFFGIFSLGLAIALFIFSRRGEKTLAFSSFGAALIYGLVELFLDIRSGRMCLNDNVQNGKYPLFWLYFVAAAIFLLATIFFATASLLIHKGRSIKVVGAMGSSFLMAASLIDFVLSLLYGGELRLVSSFFAGGLFVIGALLFAFSFLMRCGEIARTENELSR